MGTAALPARPGKGARDASTSPGWASEVTRRTPRRPRARSERRNASQAAPSAEVTTSSPSDSGSHRGPRPPRARRRRPRCGRLRGTPARARRAPARARAPPEWAGCGTARRGSCAWPSPMSSRGGRRGICRPVRRSRQWPRSHRWRTRRSPHEESRAAVSSPTRRRRARNCRERAARRGPTKSGQAPTSVPTAAGAIEMVCFGNDPGRS